MKNKNEDNQLLKQKFKYEAFISYKHTTIQSRLTSVLQREIEHFTIPKELRRNNQRHLLPIFRDKEELGVSSNLDETLKEALDQSHFLILFCSLETFQSKWVLEEVKYFLKNHPVEDVLPVLISGEPNQVFPKEITQKEDPDQPGKFLTIEPLALDARGENLNQQIRLIKKEKFRIISRMLNTSYDSLVRRQREYKLKQRIAFLLAISMLGISFGTYATLQNRQIETLFSETRKNLIETKALEAWNLISQGEWEKALDLFSQFNNFSDQSLSSALYYPLSEMTEVYSPVMDISSDLRLKTLDQVHFLCENKTNLENSSFRESNQWFDFNQDYLLFIDDYGKLYIYSILEKGLVGCWTNSDFEKMFQSTQSQFSSYISPIDQAVFVEKNKIVVHYGKNLILFNFEIEKVEKSLESLDEGYFQQDFSWESKTLAVYNSSNLSIYDNSLNLIRKIEDIDISCLNLEESKERSESFGVEKLIWNMAGNQLLVYAYLGSDEWYPSDPGAPYSPPSSKYGLYLIDFKKENIQKLGEDQRIYSIFELDNDWIVLQKLKEEPVIYANFQEYTETLGLLRVGETPCHLIRFHQGREAAISPTYNIYGVDEQNFSLTFFGEDKIPTLEVNGQVIFLNPQTLAPTETLRINQPILWIEGLNKDQFLVQTMDGNVKVVNKIKSPLFDTEFKICSYFDFVPLRVFPIYSSNFQLKQLLFFTHDSLGYSIIQYKLKEIEENTIPTEDKKGSLLRINSTQDFLLTLSSLSENTNSQKRYSLTVYDLNERQEVFNQSLESSLNSDLDDYTLCGFFPATQIFARNGENNLIIVEENKIKFHNLEESGDSIITPYSLIAPRFACISNDGRQIFISGKDKNLVFFDENQDGNFEREIQFEMNFLINGGEWTANGNYLILAGEKQLSFWSKSNQELMEVEVNGDLIKNIENVITINSDGIDTFSNFPSSLGFGGFRIGKEKNRVLYGADERLYVIDLDKKSAIQTFEINEFDRSGSNQLTVYEIDFTNHDETLLIKDVASNNSEDDVPIFHRVDLSTGISQKLTIPNRGNDEPFLYGHVLFADNLGQEFILSDISSGYLGWSQFTGILRRATSCFKIDQKEEVAFLQWVSKFGNKIKVDFENKKIWIILEEKVFVFPIYSYDELLKKTIDSIEETLYLEE